MVKQHIKMDNTKNIIEVSEHQSKVEKERRNEGKKEQVMPYAKSKPIAIPKNKNSLGLSFLRARDLDHDVVYKKDLAFDDLTKD